MREKDPETRKPKGGVNLHFDQRVFLRCILRFMSVYGVFPRGWGKCVSGDTYLFTDKGVLPIRDFFKCEEIIHPSHSASKLMIILFCKDNKV